MLKKFFLPRYAQKHLKEVLNIKSLTLLIKRPKFWIKENSSKMKYLFKISISYLFKKPIIRWLDYNVEGFLKFYQAIELYNISKSLPEKSTIVEIGAYLGRSTCFLAEAIRNKKIQLYSIDTFENQAMSEGKRNTFNEYFGNIYRYKSIVNIVKGFSYNVIKNFQHLKINLLWVDADHSYEACKKDIEDWMPLVKKEGFLIFHDYKKDRNSGVTKAVNEKINDLKLKQVKQVGQLMITKKV
ncbi:MAG: class I SAM-dependent methyltransferase [Promethearchaeota archaeon]